MPELRSAEAAISETMFYMSFLLVLSLLIIAQSTSSCSKAPARALNISGQFRTGFDLKGEQS